MHVKAHSKQDIIYFNATGSTSTEYAQLLDMSGYDRVDFFISAMAWTKATHAAEVHKVNFAAYTASAASVTAPVAITSATGSMGQATANQIAGAARLYLNFATRVSAVSATFSINGVEFKQGTAGSGTNTAGYFSSIATAGGASAHGTYDSEKFATYFGTTYHGATAAANLRNNFYASTAGPSTVWPVFIAPKKDASTMTLTATVSTLCGMGFMCVGHLGVLAAAMGTNQYVTIGVNSCTTKIPVSVMAIRSAGRTMPQVGGLAYSKLCQTTA